MQTSGMLPANTANMKKSGGSKKASGKGGKKGC